ncbi:MAG: hypothetical protein HZB72_06885 [Burkholderiales bacterium]|nr:hypothetical protein [Burkholderiales bacterium]
MTPQTEEAAVMPSNPLRHASIPSDRHDEDGAQGAGALRWRRGVSLSEDVVLRQQWSADVEPLLVAQ